MDHRRGFIEIYKMNSIKNLVDGVIILIEMYSIKYKIHERKRNVILPYYLYLKKIIFFNLK